MTTDHNGNEHYVNPEDLSVSIHVYGIAVRDGKVLIVPQFDGYDWPGGTFEMGEDTVQTLRREFKEETGFEVEPIKLLDIETSFFHHHKSNKDYHSVLVFYLVDIVDGKLSKDGFSADEQKYAKLAEWVNLENLRKMHYVCNIDIADKIINLVKKELWL